MALLPQAFYRRDALTVAHDLIGTLLVRDEVVLRVTEVEAYRVGDTASHCRAGKTARNAPMWGPPGRAYIYLCYGLHQMLNLVTDEDGVGAAVLVRAAELVSGEATVLERRRWTRPLSPALLTGPGRVAQALGLDATMNDHPLYRRGGLELHAAPAPRPLAVGPRIGIDYASPEDRQAPWRVADAESRWVAERHALSTVGDAHRGSLSSGSARRSNRDRPARR